VRVVDEAQQRPLLRRLSQEAQDGQGNEKAVVATTRCQAKRSSEGIRLRLRHLLEVTQDRAQELVQGRERERRLRLDTVAGEHSHVGPSLASVLQQCRLPDPRLTADDENAASRLARALEEPADDRALRIPAVQQHLDRRPPPTARAAIWPMRWRIDARHRDDTLTRIQTTTQEDAWRRAATR